MMRVQNAAIHRISAICAGLQPSKELNYLLPGIIVAPTWLDIIYSVYSSILQSYQLIYATHRDYRTRNPVRHERSVNLLTDGIPSLAVHSLHISGELVLLFHASPHSARHYCLRIQAA